MSRMKFIFAAWGFLSLTLVRCADADLEFQQKTNNLEECIHPRPDSCNFYAECLESRYHCGPSGYPIDFGQRFCEKSLIWKPKMSPSGQEWITKTMLCLQEQLVPFAIGSETPGCSELEKYALSTHAGCYVKSGVCTLPIEDWGRILEIVLPALVSDPENFKSAFATAKDCVRLYIWLIGKEAL